MNTTLIEVKKREPVQGSLRIHFHEKKGRCVVANRTFSCGEIIEICPIIRINPKEQPFIEKTILENYCYNWDNKDSAFLLGFGSLYNHSYSPNTFYERDMKNNIMTFIALRDISAGEEITVNYNGSPEKKEKIDWFEVCE